MPRHVMKDKPDLVCTEKPRGPGFERVVALIRIEGTELAAKNRFVVGDNSRPSSGVAEDVEFAAEVRVPAKLLAVVAAEHVSLELKVVPREEVEVIGRRVEWLRAGYLSESRCGEENDGGDETANKTIHPLSFSSSSASRRSRSATRRRNAGS